MEIDANSLPCLEQRAARLLGRNALQDSGMEGIVAQAQAVRYGCQHIPRNLIQNAHCLHSDISSRAAAWCLVCGMFKHVTIKYR